MTHQGSLIREAFRKSGLSVNNGAKKLGVTRQNLYYHFKQEIVDAHFMRDVIEKLRLKIEGVERPQSFDFNRDEAFKDIQQIKAITVIRRTCGGGRRWVCEQ